ncbi:MAG: rRNA maturation RNase YbeY [Nitrospirota bacterium]
MKIQVKNQQRIIKINQQKIISLLKKALHLLNLHKAEISVLFVNDRRMRILNHQYRGVDRTTDVLAFPQIETKIPNLELKPQNFILGDIVINLHKAKRQAIEYGITFNTEVKKLLIHGILHLIGYDHEKGGYPEKKMRRKERELFEKIH